MGSLAGVCLVVVIYDIETSRRCVGLLTIVFLVAVLIDVDASSLC